MARIAHTPAWQASLPAGATSTGTARMDGGFRPNIGQILANIEKAEVMTLFFPMLGRALIVDTRADAVEGPIIKIAPMVNSIEERIKSIERLRPRFGRPESVMAIPWMAKIKMLDELGIWQRLTDRLTRTGGDSLRDACRDSFEELSRLERRHVVAAVTGEGYRTIWQRT